MPAYFKHTIFSFKKQGKGGNSLSQCIDPSHAYLPPSTDTAAADFQ